MMAKKKNQNKTVKRKLNLLKGKILYDNILIKPYTVEEEGLIVKPQQYEDKDEYGEVLAVGEGRIFDNGTIIPLKVKVGDFVMFQKYSPIEIRSNGEDYLIVREEDICWIANKS